jgi:outer membrane protein
MKKETSVNFTMINTVAIVLLILYLLLDNFVFNKKENLKFVDNVKLFKDFNMSKDMEKIYTDSLKSQANKVQGLYDIFQNSIEMKLEQKSITSNQILFQSENKKLEDLKSYFSNDVSQKVWNRLNDYIVSYGKENKIKIIFGSQGNGNLMYADSLINITDDVLKYCNEKYEGKEAP